MSDHFIARGQNAWGSGKDPRTALANCRKNCTKTPPGRAAFVVHKTDAEAYVDGLGGLCSITTPKLVGYFDWAGRAPVTGLRL